MRFVRSRHFCIVIVQRHERFTRSFEYTMRSKVFRYLIVPIVILFHIINPGASDNDRVHRINYAFFIPILLNDTDRSFVMFSQHQANTFDIEDVIGISGQEIPLNIKIPENIFSDNDASVEFTFLMFRGLPEGIKLSSGFQSGRVFIVSIKERSGLALIPPVDYSGQFPLQVLLYRGSGNSPMEHTISVSIAGAGDNTRETVQPSVTASLQPADKQQQAEATAKLSADHEAEMMAQGQNHVQTGNIVFARLIFEDLAVQGSANGAFALAQTYDPQFLQNIQIVGLEPDFDKAKEWYQKAAQLGSQLASERLAAIDGSGS